MFLLVRTKVARSYELSATRQNPLTQNEQINKAMNKGKNKGHENRRQKNRNSGMPHGIPLSILSYGSTLDLRTTALLSVTWHVPVTAFDSLIDSRLCQGSRNESTCGCTTSASCDRSNLLSSKLKLSNQLHVLYIVSAI